MKITGKTKVVGIFGDPVTHSLSPAMHNAAFEAAKLDYVYVPFHVKLDDSADLKKAVEGIRAMNIRGVNVTIPHKERVGRFLDEVNSLANHIGAVNTIVNDNGRLIGYNTDATGYYESLLEDVGLDLAGKNVIIVGAGGGARAVFCAVFVKNPKSVTIVNRTVEKAENLAAEFRKKFMNVQINVVSLAKDNIRQYASDADLFINTTPVGMAEMSNLNQLQLLDQLMVPFDIDFNDFPSHTVVSDIVYTPSETGLIRRAKARGLKTVSGLGMLVHQGAAAFELWTGVKPDINVMREAALKALGEKKGQ